MDIVNKFRQQVSTKGNPFRGKGIMAIFLCKSCGKKSDNLFVTDSALSLSDWICSDCKQQSLQSSLAAMKEENTALKKLEEAVIKMHWRMFPNYEYCDPQTSCDLAAADQLANRKERDDAKDSLAHAAEIIGEIREHEHCKIGCKTFGYMQSLLLDNHENEASKLGHLCAASIASKFTGENPAPGMRERLKEAESVIDAVISFEDDDDDHGPSSVTLSRDYRAKFPKEGD